MKILLRTSTLIFLAILFSNFSVPNNISLPANVIGNWEFSVLDAPYEYQKGELTIEKIGDILSGVTLLNDENIEIEDVVLEQKTLTFNIYVEDTLVSFKLNFEGKTFSGNVSYSEEILSVSGLRKD